MATTYTGTFANDEIAVKIDTTGGGSTPTYAPIKELTSFKFSISSKAENWTPFDTEGWENNYVTGKGIKIDCEAKRSIGDPGNDYIYGLAMKIGKACETTVQITNPDGKGFTIPVAINVKDMPGDEGTKVAVLKFEMLGKGKPTEITPAA